MENKFNYVTKLDVKFGHLERMDVPQMVADCKDKWFNQTLTKKLVTSSSPQPGI